ncbi:MAG: M64 family metallopeptidase [Phycisphaerales bacterium]|nr:M64 family metallopeptidase [Phycisphaerales bacterium]
MRHLIACAVVLSLAAWSAPGESTNEAPAPARAFEATHDHVNVESIEHPRLTNCVVPTESLRFSSDPIQFPRGSVNVETIHDSGDPTNRLDFVFVGDGYTATEIPAYMNMAQDRADFILDFKPFDQYQNWINIHRVDVISAESGIDNDPANGNIDVDTAMNMYLADGTTGGDLLLMEDWSLGHAYANLAPDADCIVAAGNTITWCGAGTHLDIATFCGSNSYTDQIMMHEIGHSLMHLADEYINDGVTHTGGELPHRNISIMNAEEMSVTSAKWAHWLGYSLPGIGIHNTYEGGHFCEFGIYRPSLDSLMNWLENPLNGPGIEGAILQMHLAVDPIEAVSHADLFVDANVILSADILHPNGHQLEITWRVNGDVVATGSSTLDLGSITLPAGANLVQLTVVDPNPLVRDERLRSDFLTTRRAWVVNTGTSPAGACCLDTCIETSRAECEAQSGYWIPNLTCSDTGCDMYHECMLIDAINDDVHDEIPPSLDIVRVVVRRLPGNLLEASIELEGPPLPADDPSAPNRLYRISVDTEAPYMEGLDWEDVDHAWSVMPVGGSYRGSDTGVLDEVLIEGNTITMWIDPIVLGAATEIAFIADAVDWGGSGWWFDQAYVGRGVVPTWEDLDDDGIPDHCEAPDCDGDISGDGHIGVDDLLAIIAAWGSDDAAADLDVDGIVGVDDLLLVIGGWGECP